MNASTIISIAFLIAVIASYAVMFYLAKKNILTKNDLSSIDNSLEFMKELADTMDADIFGRLIEYVQMAVHAVEQMYSTGVIAAENRKNEALSIVEDYATLEGIVFTNEMKKAASSLIEAECNFMKNEEVD